MSSKAQAVVAKGEILRFVSVLNELGSDILENVKDCGDDADGLLGVLSMSLEDCFDLAAKSLMRYQELKATGNLRASNKAESAAFVKAAKTLLRSQAVPELIASSRRFLKAKPDSLVESLVELGEKSNTIARACSTVLERVKKCAADTGGFETWDIER